MAEKSQGVSMPGAFGGLMRYSEEYTSKFMLKPTHVIAFVVAILVFRFILSIFFPVSGAI